MHCCQLRRNKYFLKKEKKPSISLCFKIRKCRNSLVVQRVKDPVWSLLWHGFDPSSQLKKKKNYKMWQAGCKTFISYLRFPAHFYPSLKINYIKYQPQIVESNPKPIFKCSTSLCFFKDQKIHRL